MLNTTQQTKEKTSPVTPFDKTFDATMAEVTETMPTYQQRFSKVIHHKTVERFSDGLTATVGRPNALLFGAVTSFAVTLAVYLLAKSFGYNLSGFESIAAFAIGWVVGFIFDLLSSRRTKKP